MFGIITRLKKTQTFWNVIGTAARFWPANFRAIPESIIIEPTNACNLRCPVCPTASTMQRKRGMMSMELFRSLIDELAKLGNAPIVNMNFAGEPLLHPRIGEFVTYASSKKVRTSISTNATSLTEELAEQLVRGGLTGMRLCIDGMTKEAHEAYRIGSDFNEVKRNIEMFLAVRKRIGSASPNCVIQTLATSLSEKQLDEAKRWAISIGADNISIKSLNLHGDAKRAADFAYLLPIDKRYQRVYSGVRKTICGLPQTQAVVYWNGDLGLCCIDYENEVKLGNVAEKGLFETYFSPEAVRQRRNGMLMQHEICKTCSLAQADFLFNVNDFGGKD